MDSIVVTTAGIAVGTGVALIPGAQSAAPGVGTSVSAGLGLLVAANPDSLHIGDMLVISYDIVPTQTDFGAQAINYTETIIHAADHAK